MPDKKKILVVDDDEDIVKLVRLRLLSAGYVVNTATSGADVLDKIRKNKPDLIISDLVMPEMGGWNLLQYLRDNKQYEDILVIILSALIEKSGKSGAMELGDYYMTKPFDAQKLLKKVDELLKKKS